MGAWRYEIDLLMFNLDISLVRYWVEPMYYSLFIIPCNHYSTCMHGSKFCIVLVKFLSFYRTLSNWLLEFEKWTPSIIVVSYKVRLEHCACVCFISLCFKLWQWIFKTMNNKYQTDLKNFKPKINSNQLIQFTQCTCMCMHALLWFLILENSAQCFQIKFFPMQCDVVTFRLQLYLFVFALDENTRALYMYVCKVHVFAV